MTTDVIALTERMPDVWSLVAGLVSGGTEGHATTRGAGAVVQLGDAEGRPLVSVEAPLLVRTPGEAARLLGTAAVPDVPLWWTEIRAATGVPDAGRLAGVIATRLVSLLGGAVWPPGAAAPDGGAAPVTGLSAGAGTAAPQPAVDVLTEQTAAVIMDRPVVPMSAWLADALRGAEDGGRALAIVTESSARLSLPVRSVLSGLPNRWVVRDGDQGYYDGLSGSVLRWENGAFAATGTPAPAFVTATGRALGEDGQQLLLTFRTRDLAANRLRLGGALETVWRRLTGAAPAGWGTAEPACLPWSRDELTRLARTRAPEPTWLTVVGHPDRPAIATLRVSRTTGGVEQECVLALGYPAGRAPDPDALPELAEELVADHALVTLLCQHRAARADLTVPPYLEAAPAPLAFVLGADGLRETGQERAERPPVPVRPRRLGSASAAGCYYPLQHAGWEVFQQLMGHLRAAANRDQEQPRSGLG